MVCVLSAQTCCTANHFRQGTNTSGTVIYWRLGAMVFQWQDVENNKARLILGEICWQSYASQPLLLQDRAWTGYLHRHNLYQFSKQNKASETLLLCQLPQGSQLQALLGTKKCTMTVTWLFSTAHWIQHSGAASQWQPKCCLTCTRLNRVGRERVNKGKKALVSPQKNVLEHCYHLFSMPLLFWKALFTSHNEC